MYYVYIMYILYRQVLAQLYYYKRTPSYDGFRVFSRRRHDDNIIAVFLFIIRPEQDYYQLTKKNEIE